MRYFYLLVFGGVCLIGAYVAGGRVGTARCQANAAAQSMNAHVQTIKQKEKVNAETNHTAVRDIRRILREKYTIAE